MFHPKKILMFDDKLSPNDELIYEIAAISPTCSGNDGMIELIIIQGTDPIDVVWDNGTIGNPNRTD
jgi:hypothetical protein